MSMYQTLQQKVWPLVVMMALLIVAIGATACNLQLAEAELMSAEQQSEELVPEEGDPQTTASLIARHEVKDFGAWKTRYDGGAEIRQASGVIATSVHRDLDNVNMVTVNHQFADAAAAKAHADQMNSDRFLTMAEEVGIVLPVEVLLVADVE